MKKVLITGANGFIGKELCLSLHKMGYEVIGGVRKDFAMPGIKIINVGEINKDTEWGPTLQGVEIVVHLASRVHIMQDKNPNPLEAYREVNVEGTAKLAKACCKAGVKKFIFLSSIKVNGEGKDQPYVEEDIPSPADYYGVSKWEAEKILQKIFSSSEVDFTIIRPPLVYGPEVKANFHQLIKAVNYQLPLPLKRVQNMRSFIFIGNLINAINKVIQSEQKSRATYLISDGEDCSTSQLISKMSHILGRPCRLFAFPPNLLDLLLKILRKGQMGQRLFSSLTVSNQKFKKDLDWTPPYTLDEGLRLTLQNFFQKGKTEVRNEN